LDLKTGWIFIRAFFIFKDIPSNKYRHHETSDLLRQIISSTTLPLRQINFSSLLISSLSNGKI